MNGYVVAVIASFVMAAISLWYVPRLREAYCERHPEKRDSRWFCFRCGEPRLWNAPKRNGHYYCGFSCQQAVDPVTFCGSCLAQTEPAPPGIRLEMGHSVASGLQRCPEFSSCYECSSEICRVGPELLGVAMGDGALFRVIFLSGDYDRGPVVLRKIRSAESSRQT